MRTIRITRFILFIFIVITCSSYLAVAQRVIRARSEIPFPDIPGYITLKCDFHSHTVFSDGLVWPTIRIEEAWREGLDAIAISDHIEYLPHTNDMIIKHGRSYQLTTNLAGSLDILVIPAAEITRGEPPGHWNALFVTNINALVQTNYFDAVSNAFAQGAFIFWNHPGWKQPDWKSVWYKEQETVYRRGHLAGIEIVNGDTYDPIAHRWCIEKNLTIIGNTDIHNPIGMDYETGGGNHRPMTLVFATQRTLNGIREALFERRTAVWYENILFGDEQYLAPLFYRSIQISTPKPNIRPRGSTLLHIKNLSPINYELKLSKNLKEVSVPKKLTLVAGKTVLLEVRNGTNNYSGAVELSLPYIVTNLVTKPGESLSIDLKCTLNFVK
ncbi:MAG: Sb-PDE family phosphodiesterase [Verrucomicrobiia bacterium]